MNIETAPLGDRLAARPAIIAAPETGKGRIERAALRLFSASTIEGVSTKRIAQTAGVSEGLLYKHFKSKDALARALMLAIHDRLTQMITSIAETNAPLEDKIRHIIIEYCHIADTDWELFRYHILHLHRFPNLSNSPEANPHGAASALLKTAMDAGEIASEEEGLLASMVLGIVLQTAQSKILGLIEGPLLPRSGRLSTGVFSVLGLEG